jgi:hypothetical protein
LSGFLGQLASNETHGQPLIINRDEQISAVAERKSCQLFLEFQPESPKIITWHRVCNYRND